MRWFITDFKRGLSERSFLGAIALGILSLALGSVFSLYLAVGMLSMVFSLLTHKEAYALFLSLIIGILTSAVFVYVLDFTSQMSVASFAWRNGILFASMVLTFIGALWITYKRDFNIERKE